MGTTEYATFRYDTVEVENGQRDVSSSTYFHIVLLGGSAINFRAGAKPLLGFLLSSLFDIQ